MLPFKETLPLEKVTWKYQLFLIKTFENYVYFIKKKTYCVCVLPEYENRITKDKNKMHTNRN